MNLSLGVYMANLLDKKQITAQLCVETRAVAQDMQDAVRAVKPVFKTKRLALFLGTVSLFSVAAFAIAPQNALDKNAQKVVLSELVLQPQFIAADAQKEGAGILYRTEQVESNDTIGSLFARLGIEDLEAQRILISQAAEKEPVRLETGNTVQVQLAQDSGKLLDLSYVDAKGKELHIYRENEKLQVKIQEVALFSNPVSKTFVMEEGSFIALALRAEIPDSVTEQLQKAMQAQFDLRHDLHAGDRITVVYESRSNAAQTYQVAGDLLAAEVQTSVQRFTAIGLKNAQGKLNYYAEDGSNLQKSPFNFPLAEVRVTSPFSSGRLHPVLGIVRAHKGVDFGAASGTPVMAPADGVVTTAGFEGGYGNVVKLKHTGPYSTLYGHLSKFPDNIKVGSRIKQGQVIGYVGSTGVSTGPHLHYEFHVNDVAVDPLMVKMGVVNTLNGKDKVLFASNAEMLTAQIALTRDSFADQSTSTFTFE